MPALKGSAGRVGAWRQHRGQAGALGRAGWLCLPIDPTPGLGLRREACWLGPRMEQLLAGKASGQSPTGRRTRWRAGPGQSWGEWPAHLLGPTAQDGALAQSQGAPAAAQRAGLAGPWAQAEGGPGAQGQCCASNIQVGHLAFIQFFWCLVARERLQAIQSGFGVEI